MVKHYMKRCFGFDPPPSGSNSAYGYWSNFPNPLSKYFNKVAYKVGLPPGRGSIPIWNTSVGDGAGHIDVWLEGDGKEFLGLDQNWNGRQTHYQRHDYANIVGWLQPKSMSKLTDFLGDTNEDALITRLTEHLGSIDGKCAWGKEPAVGEENRGGYLGSARREIRELNKKLQDCESGQDPNPPVQNEIPEEIQVNGKFRHLKQITKNGNDIGGIYE